METIGRDAGDGGIEREEVVESEKVVEREEVIRSEMEEKERRS